MTIFAIGCMLTACSDSSRSGFRGGDFEDGNFRGGDFKHNKDHHLTADTAKLRDAQAIEVSDYLGRQVRLNHPAKRIIALSPHIVENIFSVGAGGRIIATVEYSDFPEAAKNIPRLAGYSNFSVESILDLRPDLVVAWPSGDGLFDNLLNKLEAFSIAVYADDPASLEDIARSLRDLGMLTGRASAADQAAEDYLASLKDLRAKYAAAKSVSVFYQIWDQPLQTLNKKHLASQVISLCGGENIFADAAMLAPQINLESLLQRDPQVIIASARPSIAGRWFADWQRWRNLQAVSNQQLYTVNPDWLSRQSTRMLAGATQLCGHLELARLKIY